MPVLLNSAAARQIAENWFGQVRYGRRRQERCNRRGGWTFRCANDDAMVIDAHSLTERENRILSCYIPLQAGDGFFDNGSMVRLFHDQRRRNLSIYTRWDRQRVEFYVLASHQWCIAEQFLGMGRPTDMADADFADRSKDELASYDLEHPEEAARVEAILAAERAADASGPA